MRPKERFYAAIEYKEPDRLPVRHYGVPEINKQLMEYFNVETYDGLLNILGDDFRTVEPRYIGPELKTFEDGSVEGLWGERYASVSFEKGTYQEAVYLPFKDVTEVSELDDFRFPSPGWYDYSEIKSRCQGYPDFAICTGRPGILDFINGISRCRGVEQVLMDIALEEPVFLELLERRFNFFYGVYERVLQEAGGLIDIMCIGEDLGNQNGLMLSPASFDRIFAPKIRAFIEMSHKYNAKVMMHCCGSCFELIPRFIESGLDILEVIQVDAKGMDIKRIYDNFYGKITLCGSISVQSTLPFGTLEDIQREVSLRKELYKKGGMILSPTHNIQVGTPIENIIELYKAAGSFKPQQG